MDVVARVERTARERPNANALTKLSDAPGSTLAEPKS
jgi:hypothetical protein